MKTENSADSELLRFSVPSFFIIPRSALVEARLVEESLRTVFDGGENGKSSTNPCLFLVHLNKFSDHMFSWEYLNFG